MISIFTFIYSLIKAIPPVKSWWDQFTVFYIDREIGKMKEADKKAIQKAIYEQDQRELERQLFNMEPGLPSKIPNVEHRDSLPGVMPHSKKRRN